MPPDARLVVVVAALFGVGALLIHAIHLVQEMPAERRGRDWLKYGVYLALINGMLAASFIGRVAVGALLAIIATAGAIEMWRVLRSRDRLVAVAVVWVAFVSALGTLISGPEPAWRESFAFVLMLTATSDSFGELMGRLIGRAKAFPRLSPGKTVQGVVASIVAPVLVAWALGFLVPWAKGARLALLGLAVAVGAMSGDLFFSGIKRAVGVKDFSGVVPGHGGVLDRFDSLMVAAPVFALARAWMGGG